jgi:hypothetical protein
VSTTNSYDTIGNRSSDLPACSAVPQATAPLKVPHKTLHQFDVLLKVKVKLTLEQHTKPQRGRRGIALLFL